MALLELKKAFDILVKQDIENTKGGKRLISDIDALHICKMHGINAKSGNKDIPRQLSFIGLTRYYGSTLDSQTESIWLGLSGIFCNKDYGGTFEKYTFEDLDYLMVKGYDLTVIEL